MADKRQIRKEMVEWIDKKLAQNGAAQEAIKAKDPTTLLLQVAQACVGIREQGGNNRGPMVKLIQDTVGDPDAWAWCASFVQTCLAYVELKTNVKSPVLAHEHVLSMWNGSPAVNKKRLNGLMPSDAPAGGSIVIWQKGQTVSGHTGIVVSGTRSEFFAIEGNTEAGLDTKGRVVRDGGGVYHTRRQITPKGSMRILGFIKPF